MAEEHGLDRRSAVLTMNLAFALEQQGRIEEAVEFCERSRELHLKAFPDNPERAAIVAARQASLLAGQQRHRESLDLALEVVGMFRDVYGTKPHPYLANALTLMATPAMALEEFEMAAEAGAEALGIYEQVYGEEHQALLVLLDNQSQVLLRLARYDEVLEAATRGLRIAERQGDRADWLRAEFLRRSADALLDLGRHVEAQEFAAEAISFVASSEGRARTDTAVLARTTIAESLALRDLAEEAEAVYRQAWEEAADPAASSGARMIVAGRISKFFERQGRAEEAASWRRLSEAVEASGNR